MSENEARYQRIIFCGGNTPYDDQIKKRAKGLGYLEEYTTKEEFNNARLKPYSLAILTYLTGGKQTHTSMESFNAQGRMQKIILPPVNSEN